MKYTNLRDYKKQYGLGKIFYIAIITFDEIKTNIFGTQTIKVRQATTEAGDWWNYVDNGIDVSSKLNKIIKCHEIKIELEDK